MAIQLRRGVYTDFDPTKLMPGEFAVVTNDDPDGNGGQAIYMCFGSNIVKRLVGADDLQDILDALTLSWNDITGKPSSYPSAWTSVSGKPNIDAGTGVRSIIANENTTASGLDSFAINKDTTASGPTSFACGSGTTASGSWSKASGYQSEASGMGASAEGYQTESSGSYSHAENYDTTASGNYSHVEGRGTIAARRAQHVFGEYNVLDPSGSASDRGKYIEIVGKGLSDSTRSNARTLDWSGNEVLAGKLTVGAAPTANMDVATKQYVDNSIGGVSQVKFTDPNGDGNIVVSFT